MEATMTSNAQADYEISGGGSLFVVTPLNADAKENLFSNVDEEAQHWGGGIVCEARFIGGLVEQLRAEGWSVR
jgi:hypothetical protein